MGEEPPLPREGFVAHCGSKPWRSCSKSTLKKEGLLITCCSGGGRDWPAAKSMPEKEGSTPSVPQQRRQGLASASSTRGGRDWGIAKPTPEKKGPLPAYHDGGGKGQPLGAALEEEELGHSQIHAE